MKKDLKFFKTSAALLLPLLIAFQVCLVCKYPNEKALSEAKASTQSICEDNKIENITVDCAFSIGGWCICAEQLGMHNLRRTSSPLDWMRKYSLDTVATLFETKFKNFFKNAIVTKKPNECGARTLYDANNHIESIHYIPANAPFDEAYNEFKTVLQRRARKVNHMIETSKSVLLLNCRNDHLGTSKNSTDRDLKNFTKRFSKVYPNLKKIYLVDIHNDKNEKIRKRVVYQDNKIKIVQYKFKNIDNENFEPNWLGNQKAWDKIMKNIHLTRTISK